LPQEESSKKKGSRKKRNPGDLPPGIIGVERVFNPDMSRMVRALEILLYSRPDKKKENDDE